MAYNMIIKHSKVNFSSGNSGRKYIVIHYTGNKTDTAAANANYFYSASRGASAHYFVDKSNVYEVVSTGNTAWAVGKNYGANNLFGICTNRNSLSIEMCSDGGEIADATFANTVSLTQTLMTKYKIPASRVVRHYDVCSKQCPGWYGWTGSDTSIWSKFKSAIGGSFSPASSGTSGSGSSVNSINWIAQLQNECNTQGFSNQKVDGIAGKNTLAGCPTLKQGARGNITKMMQSRVGTTADGIFGANTKSAVIAFQRRHGLTADGIVGKNTWRKILGL